MSPPRIRDFVPTADGSWHLDWGGLRDAFPWIEAMHACPQDSGHHAEGDVGTHTRMVCEEMVADAGFRALGVSGQRVAFASALLHDVAKPAVTRLVDGVLSSRGHSRRGSVDARLALAAEGWDYTERETVARLIAVHQWPFTALDRADPSAVARVLSQDMRLDLLCLLATADARGRLTSVPAERQRAIDYVELFHDVALEAGCLDAPYPFPDERTCRLYCRDVLDTGTPRRPHDHPTHGYRDDGAPYDVTVMSGLPGSGKDRWISLWRPGLPMVGFDAKQAEMGRDHDDDQGAVVQAVLAEAKVFLHPAHRRQFVWNATNVSRQMRQKCLGLLEDYGARVEVVYVEATRDWNAQRPDSTRVPAAAIARMRLRWEPPQPSETHRVSVVVDDVPRPDPSLFDPVVRDPTPGPALR